MSMDEELGLSKKAGEIASEVKEYALTLPKEGVELLKIAEGIESKIKEKGGKPAFPVNLSINSIAAHYTPTFNDETTLKEGDLVKVDFGVELEGALIDLAFSKSIGESELNLNLIETSKAALLKAISGMRAGVNSREMGKVILEEANSKGFRTIENLCGHLLSEGELHAGKEIPNVDRGGSMLLEGETYAVEPFITNGKGWVSEGDFCEIYSLQRNNLPRMSQSRKVLEAAKEFGTLPFAKRWLLKELDESTVRVGLSELTRNGILHSYPVLKEAGGGMVAQTETTVLIKENEALPLVPV